MTTPVPDIAGGPPQLSADRRTYTFTLRGGVRYAPPVNREVTASDFITAIERFYADSMPPRFAPSAGQQYANLIVGAAAFAAGKAEGISGLAAPDARTLRISLVQPAGDLLSILTLALFGTILVYMAALPVVGEGLSGMVWTVLVTQAAQFDPALINVAQLLTVCGPASSLTVWLAPPRNVGASFTGRTVIENVCAAELFTPPLAVPPLSASTTVTVAVPKALGAGV